MMFGNVYKNRRVLVTGHTGFKGSWLVLWLEMMGAKVTGISLPPETSPNHWNLLGLDVESFYIDIRDENLLRQKIVEVKPEMFFIWQRSLWFAGPTNSLWKLGLRM